VTAGTIYYVYDPILDTYWTATSLTEPAGRDVFLSFLTPENNSKLPG